MEFKKSKIFLRNNTSIVLTYSNCYWCVDSTVKSSEHYVSFTLKISDLTVEIAVMRPFDIIKIEQI